MSKTCVTQSLYNKISSGNDRGPSWHDLRLSTKKRNWNDWVGSKKFEGHTTTLFKKEMPLYNFLFLYKEPLMVFKHLFMQSTAKCVHYTVLITIVRYCRCRIEALRNSSKFFNASLLNFHLEERKAIYVFRKSSLGWTKENYIFFFIVQKLGQPSANNWKHFP